MNPFKYLFPGIYAKKEANELKQAAYERYKQEQIDDMVRALMNPGRGRRR